MRESIRKAIYLVLMIMVLFAMTGCSKMEITDQNPMSTEETEISNDILQMDGYTLAIPDKWQGNYETEVIDDEDIVYTAFYAAACHKETGAGWLFSIGSYTDNSFEDLPAYDILSENNGITYVVIYSTDVQTEGASEVASEQYYELMKTVEEVINSFQLT